MAAQKYTTQQVIEAIAQGHTPTGAASILHCNPDTIRNYADRYPTVKAALLEHRKQIVDIAELGLRAAVTRGEPWAVAFALKTLARETYSERIEHTGAEGGPIMVKGYRSVSPDEWPDDGKDKTT